MQDQIQTLRSAYMPSLHVHATLPTAPKEIAANAQFLKAELITKLSSLEEKINEAGYKPDDTAMTEVDTLRLLASSNGRYLEALKTTDSIYDIKELSKLFGTYATINMVSDPDNPMRSLMPNDSGLEALSLAGYPEVLQKIKEALPIMKEVAVAIEGHQQQHGEVFLVVAGMVEDVDQLEQVTTDLSMETLSAAQRTLAEKHEYEVMTNEDDQAVRFVPPVGHGLKIISPPKSRTVEATISFDLDN